MQRKYLGKLLAQTVLGGFHQTRVYPYPLVAGSARPNPKMGAPDPENPLFLGFSVPEGDRDHGLRPWSRKGPDLKDAAFLLTVGSFLLTVELFYLQLTILAFLLTVRAFCLQF